MKPRTKCKYSVCYGFSTIYSDVETMELAFELIRGLICRNENYQKRMELLKVLDTWQGRAVAVPETDFPRFYLCGYYGNYAIYQIKRRARPARRK